MNQRQLAREKLLFRYTSALERGDFATVEAILNEARHDAELERMLYEINTALGSTFPAVNLHRYNHKDSTMQHNPTLKLTPVRERSLPTRFPYALAAAILAVILVGGLLITAKFGFDNQNGDNFGGASLQRESATVTPSATPSPLNPIVVTGTPTLFTNDPNPLDPTAAIETIVLCEARALHYNLFSRPNGIIIGSMELGQVVQVLDITLGLTLSSQADPSIANPTTVWFFVRSPSAQGWLSSRYIEPLSDCPYPTDADYIPIIHLYGTAVSSGVITLEPLVATAAAATEQAYYGDISTAIASTMYAPSPTMTDSPTPTPTMTPSVTPSPIFTATPNVCNPANPSRLSKGDQGRVIGEGRTGVNLRQNYGFDAPLIRLLDIHTEFEVVDLNAICVEGTNWYKIALDGEDAGWIPETMWVLDDGAASSVYVIEPLN